LSFNSSWFTFPTKLIIYPIDFIVYFNLIKLLINIYQIEGSEREWRQWYEKERPEEEEIPCGYQKSLDVFRRLLLIRSWSPDRTLSQARHYVMSKNIPFSHGSVWKFVFVNFTDSLGPEYGEACILDLEATWAESEPRTPLVCMLSIGSDPSPQIAALAKHKDISKQSTIRASRFFLNFVFCIQIFSMLF
jgi:dynein heavy chain, axonemal